MAKYCNKNRWIWFAKVVFCVGVLLAVFPRPVKACYYDRQTDTVYCEEPRGCDNPRLMYAGRVIVERLTRDGMAFLAQNETADDVQVADLSNLNEYDKAKLFKVLSRGNIARAAILLAYETSKESVGNDGTALYRKKMEQLCPEVKYLRSCASVVSAAVCASGFGDCKSAGTDALVTYFEKNPNWKRMGALRKNKMEPGDIIFIDRKSHAAAYLSGAMKDSEFEIDEEEEYHGGYDSTGHKNYETQDPTGSVSEVFNPDQDGDGRVNDWESEYWRCYWERVNPSTMYVPPYDYYYTWLEEAKAAAAEKERIRAEKQAALEKLRKKIIHDHIFVWTGNEMIRSFYPENTGDIVSGSYTENYKKARSAALGKYNFTGDYRVYRYIGEQTAN